MPVDTASCRVSPEVCVIDGWEVSVEQKVSFNNCKITNKFKYHTEMMRSDPTKANTRYVC